MSKQADLCHCSENQLPFHLKHGWKDSGWRAGKERPYMAVLYRDGPCPQTQTGYWWHCVTPVEIKPNEDEAKRA